MTRTATTLLVSTVLAVCVCASGVTVVTPKGVATGGDTPTPYVAEVAPPAGCGNETLLHMVRVRRAAGKDLCPYVDNVVLKVDSSVSNTRTLLTHNLTEWIFVGTNTSSSTFRVTLLDSRCRSIELQVEAVFVAVAQLSSTPVVKQEWYVLPSYGSAAVELPLTQRYVHNVVVKPTAACNNTDITVYIPYNGVSTTAFARGHLAADCPIERMLDVVPPRLSVQLRSISMPCLSSKNMTIVVTAYTYAVGQ